MSTDIEADGPIPGPHSMLSFASAAYMTDKTLVDTYHATLETLPVVSGHPDTMRWWEGHPEAWEASRQDTRPAEQVMPDVNCGFLHRPWPIDLIAIGFYFVYISSR